MSLVCRLMLKRLGIVATHAVEIRRNVRVRTPDGAELLTDLYLGGPQGAPAIIVRSPYGKSVFLAGIMAYPLASQGFNVVLQCCRGTYGSTGTFDPHHDEQRDGLTTIDWAKRQPWCNGSIATSGGSYLGYTQWAVAAAAGPEVKAMAMQITQSDFALMTYHGNSFALQNALSWTSMTVKGQQRFAMLRLMLSRLRGAPAVSAQQWRHLPLGTIDALVTGKRVPFWQDWMKHSSAEDPWWAPMGFSNTIREIKRPITMVAGWFDIFAPQQLRDFAALRQAGCDARITVGPWQHTDAGQMQMAMHDAIDWFNRHLLGKSGAPRPKRVKLYVIGADEWRYFDEWPARESVAEHQYFQPQRGLRSEPPPGSAADQYRYDPADPTPSVGGPALESAPASVDNGALEARADVLTYTSEPLAQPRDIIGTATADLYVSSSAASADFFVRLCDVDAAGQSKNICDGLQRVTIAAGGVPQRVRFELWPTAYRIARGHRVRVQVSSGAFPRWARNLGGLEPLASATELRPATQSIHHSPTHPSAVVVPFCRDLVSER
jgi:putative CocE/NonD family hydrolase